MSRAHAASEIVPSFRQTPGFQPPNGGSTIFILASDRNTNSKIDSGFRRNDEDRARGMVSA
jgi:hypothetical protein